MSDGSFQSKTLWENEENGMLAFYNGGNSETVTMVNVTAPHLRFIYGEGEASLLTGPVSDWNFSGGNWGDTFFQPDETFAGGGALGIRTTENAHAVQTVQSIEAGKTYTLTAWLKTVRGRGAIKTEFFKGNTFCQNGSILFYRSTDETWTKAEYSFTVPQNADRVNILLRVIDGGEVYWDSLVLSDGETEIPLLNAGFEITTGGTLTLKLPTESLTILGAADTMLNKIEKNNILYDGPVKGGTVRCASDAWAALFSNENRIKELKGFYCNGDIIKDGDGVVSFYRWENMQPK